MRLELRQIGGSASPAASRMKWYFERGRRTMGRAPDCDWQVPEDQRSVSKFHCTIERDRDGFILRDQSANGSKVDGVIVHEGETARLADQSHIELGGVAFSVSISGEQASEMEDPEAGLKMSDEPLTISAILADIAPGGSTGRGILGDRETDEWPIPVGPKTGAPSSRNVDIGWNGPPQLNSATKLLPDDWNADDSGSGFGSDLEHGSATHVAVPIARARPAAPLEIVNDNSPDAEPDQQVFDEAFSRLTIGRSAVLADRMDALVTRMEDALENAFSVLDIEPPATEGEGDFFGRDREDVMIARVETLIARQQWLAVSLEALLQEASRTMEPRILESRVDASARRLPFLKGRDYWQAYKAQFDRNGRTLSVRDVFREAMKRGNPAGGHSTPTLHDMAAPAGNQGHRDDEAEK